MFRAWVNQQTGLEPVPRMPHLYHGPGRGVNLNCVAGEGIKPVVDCGTNSIQMAGEEMVRTFNNDEALGLLDCCEKGLDIRS